jgi:hypothetical protein
VLSHNSNLSFDSDFQNRDLAAKLGLHQVFGSAPSVEMLLQEMANMAQEIHALLPMKSPVTAQNWNSIQTLSPSEQWILSMDDPSFGNNAEASSSSRYKEA